MDDSFRINAVDEQRQKTGKPERDRGESRDILTKL